MPEGNVQEIPKILMRDLMIDFFVFLPLDLIVLARLLPTMYSTRSMWLIEVREFQF